MMQINFHHAVTYGTSAGVSHKVNQAKDIASQDGKSEVQATERVLLLF